MKLKRFLLSGVMRVIYFLLLSWALTAFWIYLIHGIGLIFDWSFIDYIMVHDLFGTIFIAFVYSTMSVFSMAFIGITCSRFKKS